MDKLTNVCLSFHVFTLLIFFFNLNVSQTTGVYKHDHMKKIMQVAVLWLCLFSLTG